MGLRQREWARRKRNELKQLMGGVCAECGTRRRLEFDCIEPQGDWHHRAEYSQRMTFYVRQFTSGNLQLLCERHNNIKSLRENPLAFRPKYFAHAA